MSIHRWERVVLEKEMGEGGGKDKGMGKAMRKDLVVLVPVVRTRLSAGTCSLTLSGHCTARSNPD